MLWVHPNAILHNKKILNMITSTSIIHKTTNAARQIGLHSENTWMGFQLTALADLAVDHKDQRHDSDCDFGNPVKQLTDELERCHQLILM